VQCTPLRDRHSYIAAHSNVLLYIERNVQRDKGQDLCTVRENSSNGACLTTILLSPSTAQAKRINTHTRPKPAIREMFDGRCIRRPLQPPQYQIQAAWPRIPLLLQLRQLLAWISPHLMEECCLDSSSRILCTARHVCKCEYMLPMFMALSYLIIVRFIYSMK
jgi:hypothetical protein